MVELVLETQDKQHPASVLRLLKQMLSICTLYI